MTFRLSLRAALAASSLIAIPAIVGCSGGLTSTPSTTAAITVSGNWQFSSSAASAAMLPAVSGELKGTNTAMSGIFHAKSASACLSPKTPFAVTGSADTANKVTLTSANVGGGTFTLTGTLAADGKSITNAAYSVSGGTCSFAAPAAATAQAYASITGTYTGSFTDQFGDANPVSVNLTQTPESDNDGNFSMSGSGTFPQNSCFNSPASVSNAQVTGGNFSMTYTDPNTTNAITGSGTFSTDASTLTLTGWQIAGPCGNHTFSISGTLTRQ